MGLDSSPCCLVVPALLSTPKEPAAGNLSLFSKFLAANRKVQIIASIIQHIVTMSKYGHSALNIRRTYSTLIYPAIYVILCVAEKNSSFSSFFFFSINVENCALSSMC